MYILGKKKLVEIQINEEWSSMLFLAGVLIESDRRFSNLIKIRLLNQIPLRYATQDITTFKTMPS